jgi:hypothetical protein
MRAEQPPHSSRERALLPCSRARSAITPRRSSRGGGSGARNPTTAAELIGLRSAALVWLRRRRRSHGEGLSAGSGAPRPRSCRRCGEVVHLPARRRGRLPGQPRRRAARGPRALRARHLRLCNQT